MRQSSRLRLAPTVSGSGQDETVRALADALKVALRQARHSCTQPSALRYIVNLEKRIESGKVQLPFQMASLLLDYEARGADRGTLERVASIMSDAVSLRRDGTGADDLRTLRREETIAEGAANVAEVELDDTVALPELATADRALGQHYRCLGLLWRGVRRRRLVVETSLASKTAT